MACAQAFLVRHSHGSRESMQVMTSDDKKHLTTLALGPITEHTHETSFINSYLQRGCRRCTRA
ncbi:hypothetical protein M378DRAFT_161908 [Amanita muscaria Koide BX008]|uniref:Uncharacterized protein n=1 Tax=Amanita muscaria (strain Koide BX008) TaxID=946122 RepID=A0A0C2SQP6_AMAMK|nr:hypothetical protein M378DRAFT_161908 [Amanita muscaria Koide BX008]